MTQRCTKLEEAVTTPVLSAKTEMPVYAISEQLVMAGQPQPQDWSQLAADGFDLVINVRSDPQRAAVQAERARQAGLDYAHLPVPAYELEGPHLDEFNRLMTTALAERRKVLLHCRTASRTALLWLLKRQVHDGWTQAQAEAELAAAGYTDDDMEVFQFCSEDFFERCVVPEAPL